MIAYIISVIAIYIQKTLNRVYPEPNTNHGGGIARSGYSSLWRAIKTREIFIEEGLRTCSEAIFITCIIVALSKGRLSNSGLELNIVLSIMAIGGFLGAVIFTKKLQPNNFYYLSTIAAMAL